MRLFTINTPEKGLVIIEGNDEDDARQKLAIEGIDTEPIVIDDFTELEPSGCGIWKAYRLVRFNN